MATLRAMKSFFKPVSTLQFRPDAAEFANILLTGFYCDAMRINGTTNDTYIAWTEWFPAPGQNYDDFELAAGDVLKIDIVAHSKTAGFTRLHNKRTGQKKTTNYKDQTTPLCLGAAEWVIESELAFSAGGFITGERTAGYTPFEFKNAVWHGKGLWFLLIGLWFFADRLDL